MCPSQFWLMRRAAGAQVVLGNVEFGATLSSPGSLFVFGRHTPTPRTAHQIQPLHALHDNSPRAGWMALSEQALQLFWSPVSWGKQTPALAVRRCHPVHP